MSQLDDLERLNNLREINNLRESGTITSKEFDQEKQKILNSGNVNSINKNTVRLDIIGIVLSIYSVILVFVSFYIHLGIFLLDLLLVTVLSVIALLINIKAKKQVVEKSIKVTLGIGLSVVALILLLPSISNFLTNFNLYF